MALNAPKNANYAAVVKRVPAVVKLKGRDKIVGVPVLGYQAIVGLDTAVGDLVVVFPPETELDPDFLFQNDLYRHFELNKNKDPEAKGYFEDNGRVRAMKFAGHRSDCFIVTLDAFAYTGADLSQLKENDEFDVLNGHKVCQKYVVKTKEPRAPGAKVSYVSRVDGRYFPEHIDTTNYFKNAHQIAPDEIVYVTQKVHGTSVRVGNVLVARKLRRVERILRRVGVRVQETEFSAVYGSRRQTLDANNPEADYYQDGLYVREGKKLDGLIPQGYLVFGELIGWTGTGGPIQARYDYEVPPGEARLLVYRIAHVNPQGLVCDLSWSQVKAACTAWGLSHVAELWSGPHDQFVPGDWLDRRFGDTYENALPLGYDKTLVDEGVCVRSDNGFVPTILKAKGEKFLRHESAQLDAEVVDLEADQDVAA